MSRGSARGTQGGAEGSDGHSSPAGDHEPSDELREPEQTSEGTAQENGSSGESGGYRDAWWQRLVELAAVIAVPSALFYVLGLGALWVRLSSEYDLSGSDNAWFAASLVARPTAASLGAEVMLRGLFASSVAATISLAAAYGVLKVRRRGRSDRGVTGLPSLLPLIALLSCLLLFMVVFLALNREPLVPTFRVVGGLAVFYFFFFFLNWSLGTEYPALLRRTLAFYPRWLYSAIALLSVLCVGGSVLFPGEAHLPCLYRETSEGDVVDGEVLSPQRAEELEGYRTLEGGFLGHSEGHWYVFGEKSLKLEAIPDDGASRVLEGEFYFATTRIGPDGRPAGEPVTEENRKPGEAYTLSGECA